MAETVRDDWRRRWGLAGWLLPVAAGIFVFGLGQELWSRYIPEYLRFLGASALTVGAFGALQDLLDAAYAYPGGWLSDRLGIRRALLLFAVLSTAGFAVYFVSGSIPGIFVGLFLVMAWKSLGLPATFALVGEELAGSRRIVGFTVQSVLRRLPIVLAPPIGGLLIERLGMARGVHLGFGVSIGLSVAMLIGLRAAFRRKGAPNTHPLAPPSTSLRRTGPVSRALPHASRPALRSSAPAFAKSATAGGGRSLRSPSPTPYEPGAGNKRTRLHPTLKRLLAADCLIRLCEGLPDVFLVVWALEVLRLSPSQFGLATSALMGTAILSYIPAALLADRIEKKPFVIATFLFFTLFPLAVVFSRSFGHLLGAYFIGGLREVGEPARKALIVDLSALDARGKTVGLYYAIRGFAVAGAAVIGGALWTIRPSLTFYGAAILGAAGTLWAVVALPSGPRPVAEAAR